MRVNFLLAGLIFIATPIQAQAPQAPQVEFLLKVTAGELDVIGKALGKLPFEDVAQLLQKLRQQVVEQQKPKIEPEKAPEQK